jgi:hypothetical protein
LFCVTHINSIELWRPLFGAGYVDCVYVPGSWLITSDSTLIALRNEVMWTSIEYSDFELDMSFRTGEGTNSGVIVYCSDTSNWMPNSVEIQLTDDYCPRWVLARDFECCGAIYGHAGVLRRNIVKPPGIWNHVRIRCLGQSIRVILNGKTVSRMDMSLWRSGTENPDGTSIPSWMPTPFAEMPTHGYIGLQGLHGDTSAEFKNIKIRMLRH